MGHTSFLLPARRRIGFTALHGRPGPHSRLKPIHAPEGIKPVSQPVEEFPVQDDPNAVSTLVHTAMPHTDNVLAIIGELIPIIAIVMGLSVAMLCLYLDFRKKRELFQLHHAERMAAIEKGIELPPLPPEFFGEYRNREPRASRHRRQGLLLSFLGIAISVGMWGSSHERGAWWGLVFVAVGAAFLLSSRFESAESLKLSKGEDPHAQP